MTRRRLLGLGLGALGGACAGCGRLGKGGDSQQLDSEGESAGPDSTYGCSPNNPTGVEPEGPESGWAEQGWVQVDLAEHPELLEVGGQASVQVPEALLQVVLAQPTEGCFIAVWSICTHGACEVAWDDTVHLLVCPCHDSRFAPDGAVVQGPATEALSSFPVIRSGDALWIYRPR